MNRTWILAGAALGVAYYDGGTPVAGQGAGL